MSESTDGPWLVVGLGNPGPKFAGNRHNIGQMVCDELASRFGAAPSAWRAHRCRAQVVDVRLGVGPGGRPGPRLVLAKPTSYMNVSGGPVAGLAAYLQIPTERVLVVHDELDIDFGALRLKRGGGEGGHNGLRDISKALGSREYFRLRVGIGRPPGRMDAADYVLRDFSATERKELPFVISDAGDAAEQLITHGLTAAQQTWHSVGKS